MAIVSAQRSPDELAMAIGFRVARGIASGASRGSCGIASSGSTTLAAARSVRRVLCLHGYTQNGEVFKNKTGSVRKALGGCEFVFLDAPHSAVGAFPDDQASALAADGDGGLGEEVGVGPRGWWHSGENARRMEGQTWVRPAESVACEGWPESIEMARAAVKYQGPFDGILAFSQGCAVATALLREAATGTCGPLACASFAVLVGGFMPRDPEVAAALRGDGALLAVDSLHVSGTNDSLVGKERSEELASLYESSRVAWFEHPGRHGIPTGTGAFKTALRAVLDGGISTQGCK